MFVDYKVTEWVDVIKESMGYTQEMMNISAGTS